MGGKREKKQEIEAYLNSGCSYRESHQFQPAIEHFLEALKLAVDLKENNKVNETYLELGCSYALCYQIQPAIECYTKALDIAKERKNQGQMSTAYIGLGRAYRLNNQFQTAIKHYERALEIAKERGYKLEETDAYLGLGDVYILNNQIRTAIDYLQKSLQVAKEREHKYGETRAYLKLGKAYRLISQIHKAIQHYEKALEIAKIQEDKPGETKAYLGLGDTYILNDHIQTEPLQNVGKLGDKPQQNDLYIELACANYGATNQIQLAMKFFLNALEISKEREDKHGETRANLGLGDAYRLIDQNQTAKEYYEKALEIAKEQGYGLLENYARNTSEDVSRITDVVDENYCNNSMENSHRSEDLVLQLQDTDNERITDQNVDETHNNDIKAQAYQYLGNLFTGSSEYKKAIEYYKKAHEISSGLKANETELIAYQCFGDNLLQAGQYNESIEYYKEVVQFASQLGDKRGQINAYLGLGNAFSYIGEFESSRKYIVNALTVTEQISDKGLQKNAYRMLGYVYYKSREFDAAIKSYLKVQEITHDLGERKEEAIAFRMLGDTFLELKQHEKAIESYQKVLSVSEELDDNEMQVVAIQKLGTLYLTLASLCYKDCDYEGARKWYENALDTAGREPNDLLLYEKAFTGLGVTWLNLGDTEKAIESIHEAQTFAKMEDDIEHSTEQKASSSPVPDSNRIAIAHTQENSLKASSSQVLDSVVKEENTILLQETKPVIEEWSQVDAVIEKACNPSRTEILASEELVRMKKYIEISPSYVYTRQISTKTPFTKKVRQAMIENVKTSAYRSLLDHNNYKPGSNYGKFVNRDQQIFNFARNEVNKNASTKKPARLNEKFASYMRSVGQIVCGRVQGTCFLVTDELVITNYHVYRMIAKERNNLRDDNIPITVRFDYLHAEQTEHILAVEVDEEHDPRIENPYLDYKLFRLKPNENLRDRKPLGAMVRKWQLSDGRVIILGHPEGKEMQDEVCIVVGYRIMQETIKKRHELCSGVHMTNAQLLHRTEDYQGCLSYDTSFFSGASGSPVFEMNGNIVAMHTQGYLLERTEENISNQQENVSNKEQEDDTNHPKGNIPNQGQEDTFNQQEEYARNQKQDNVSGQRNSRKYSLMEFGVQFISICRDIRQWHGENVVQQIFPNYKLKPGEYSQ